MRAHAGDECQEGASMVALSGVPPMCEGRSFVTIRCTDFLIVKVTIPTRKSTTISLDDTFREGDMVRKAIEKMIKAKNELERR